MCSSATHTECIVAFLQQQWFHERASVALSLSHHTQVYQVRCDCAWLELDNSAGAPNDELWTPAVPVTRKLTRSVCLQLSVCYFCPCRPHFSSQAQVDSSAVLTGRLKCSRIFVHFHLTVFMTRSVTVSLQNFMPVRRTALS